MARRFLSSSSDTMAELFHKSITGFAAKTMCSGLFVSKMPYDILAINDLNGFPAMPRLITANVDYDAKTVSMSYGKATSVARYHGPDLGCSLVHPAVDIHSKMADIRFKERNKYTWPEAKITSSKQFENVDYNTLEATIKSESELNKKVGVTEHEIHDELVRIHSGQTRAVVVIHKGKLVGEGYNEHLYITENTPLFGWSMTKSIFATVAGVLVQQGRLSLDEVVHVNGWPHGSQKEEVTVRNMINNNAGIDFHESYHFTDDPLRMIFVEKDSAAFAARFPVKGIPGKRWTYTSATSILLSSFLRSKFKNDQDYWMFPREHLFDKIGADSMIMETDPSGTFIGSSYSYATARDWAMLGQLHLQNGMWEGNQLLPPDWIRFVTTHVTGSGGNYGGHWWLNPYAVPEKERETTIRGMDKTYMSVMPNDTYMALGHEGQFLVVIPSKALVIVRLGKSHHRKPSDTQAFFSKLINCFPFVNKL